MLLSSAAQGNIEKLKEAAKELNPRAKVIITESVVSVDNADVIRGKKVVLVEDGPTLTHGGMSYGAGNLLSCFGTSLPELCSTSVLKISRQAICTSLPNQVKSIRQAQALPSGPCAELF